MSLQFIYSCFVLYPIFFILTFSTVCLVLVRYVLFAIVSFGTEMLMVSKWREISNCQGRVREELAAVVIVILDLILKLEESVDNVDFLVSNWYLMQ